LLSLNCEAADIAALLLQKKADVSALDSEKRCACALLCVARSEKTDICALLGSILADKRCDVNVCDPVSKDSVLMVCLRLSKIPTATALYNRGANVNSHSVDGFSPLMLAAAIGDIAFIQLLLSKMHREQ
jgi:ankyrin repeat protein